MSQRDRFPVFQTEQMPDQHLPFLGPTWMDDLAVCLEGESPEQTIRKAGIAAGRLLELCTEHAMSPQLEEEQDGDSVPSSRARIAQVQEAPLRA